MRGGLRSTEWTSDLGLRWGAQGRVAGRGVGSVPFLVPFSGSLFWFGSALWCLFSVA